MEVIRIVEGGHYTMLQTNGARTANKVPEKEQVKHQIAALISEAHRLGYLLSHVSFMLTSRPQDLVFDAVPKSQKHSRAKVPIVCAKDIDGNRLVKLTNDLRESIKTLEQLKRRGH
jgi:hypothetical protein